MIAAAMFVALIAFALPEQVLVAPVGKGVPLRPRNPGFLDGSINDERVARVSFDRPESVGGKAPGVANLTLYYKGGRMSRIWVVVPRPEK
jgi:hypothetical protein